MIGHLGVGWVRRANEWNVDGLTCTMPIDEGVLHCPCKLGDAPKASYPFRLNDDTQLRGDNPYPCGLLGVAKAFVYRSTNGSWASVQGCIFFPPGLGMWDVGVTLGDDQMTEVTHTVLVQYWCEHGTQKCM